MKKISRRILSLLLAAILLLGIILSAAPAFAAETEYGTVTFKYVGSSTNVKGSNLGFYVTWGTKTYNKNATSCGITITTDGTSATLKIDKSLITDTVWMNIWDNAGHNWNGASCTFSGETYYLYDDKVSTEPPAGSGDEGGSETTPDYGTSTFTYVGSNTAVTGANLKFWVTWGTSTVNAYAENCGVEITTSGNSATLKVDKNTLTDSKVWMNISENKNWTNWNGVSCTFSGETYYIYDDKVSTEAPADPEDPGDNQDPVEYATVTFEYAGSDAAVTGADLGFWVKWGTKTYEANATSCGITITTEGKTATLKIDKTLITNPPVYINIWDNAGHNWDGKSYNFDGGTYYLCDNGVVSTTAPGDSGDSGDSGDPDDPVDPSPAYSFTVHCYGEGYQLGAWLALVEKGKETAWTDEGASKTAALANAVDGWTSAVVSWDLAESYNRLGFKVGEDDPWAGREYHYDFTEPTGDVWIVPGYEGAYATAEEALANAWSNYYQFTVYCYGAENWKLGGWLAKVSNGKEVSWTPEKDSQTGRLTYLRDNWSVATVSWSYKTRYSRFGFQIDEKDPWKGQKYSHDFKMHQEEIWVIPGDPTVYTSEKAALESLNDPASAKYSFLVHCYGEGYQIGAWLAKTEGGEEVAWTDADKSVTGSFETAKDGWSEVWVRWNLEEEYNRLGFQIDKKDPWAGQKYNVDFVESPGEVWIVPGDVTVYQTQQEAEEAMTPGVETTTPPETEPTEAVTEPVAQPTEEAEAVVESTDGGPNIAVILLIAAVAIGFIWWLLMFLRKRKNQK